MKKLKLITITALLIIFIFLFINKVTAIVYVDNLVYDGVINTKGEYIQGTNPVNNINVIGFVCLDKNCQTVSQNRLWNANTLTTGDDNQITIEYPTVLENNNGYLVYMYKEGYTPWKLKANWAGSGQAPRSYNNYLYKKEECHAPINEFRVINDVQPNVPLVIGVSASLDATTYSAFSCTGNEYIPESIKDHFSAKTKITLDIYKQDMDGSFKLYRTEEKIVSILCSSTVRAEFTWTPSEKGNYNAVARTEIIDEKCLSSVPDSTEKRFHVLANEPRNMCYTLLNDLTINDPFPVAGETIDVSYTKISNYADDNYVLFPTGTFITYTITRKSDGAIMYHEENIPKLANFDSETPKNLGFPWFTPDYEPGNYEIRVDGIAADPRCANLDNTGETVILNVNIGQGNSHKPVLESIPDQTVPEDYPEFHYKWIDLHPYSSDPDTQDKNTFTYKIVSQSNPILVNCYIDTEHYITCGAPLPDGWGQSHVVVEMSDGQYTDRDDFYITVEQDNDRPLIGNIPNQNFKEEECVEVNLDQYVTDIDTPKSELIWSVSDFDPSQLKVEIIKTADDKHNAKICGAKDWFGQDVIVFTVSDGTSSDSDNVLVTVSDIADNSGPYLNLPESITFEAGKYYRLNMNDPEIFHDDQPFLLMIWSMTGNTNVKMSPEIFNSALLFSSGVIGDETVTITVRDPNGLTATDTMVVHVVRPADVKPNIIMTELTLYTNECKDINLNNQVDYPNYLKQELTWTSTNNFYVTVAVDNNLKNAKFCAGAVPGTDKITLTVKDSLGNIDTQDVLVKVIEKYVPPVVPPNTAPVLAGMPDVIMFINDQCQTYNLDTYVTDNSPKSDLVWSVTTSAVAAVSTVAIEPNHIAKFCPVAIGTSEYSFTVKDPEGLTATDTITVKVMSRNKVNVTILYPNGEETLKGNVTVLWNAVSTNNCPNGISNVKIEYSTDYTASWSVLADNLANTGSYQWNTDLYPNFVRYYLRVTAIDCAESGFDVTDTYFTINNQEPVIIPEKPKTELYIPTIVFMNENSETPYPGEELKLKITVENTGGTDLKDLKMTVYLHDLEEVRHVGPFDLKDGRKVTKDISLDVPYYAQPDTYPLRITISNTQTKRVVYRDIWVQ